jgi:hypothetical protein
MHRLRNRVFNFKMLPTSITCIWNVKYFPLLQPQAIISFGYVFTIYMYIVNTNPSDIIVSGFSKRSILYSETSLNWSIRKPVLPEYRLIFLSSWGTILCKGRPTKPAIPLNRPFFLFFFFFFGPSAGRLEKFHCICMSWFYVFTNNKQKLSKYVILK